MRHDDDYDRADRALRPTRRTLLASLAGAAPMLWIPRTWADQCETTALVEIEGPYFVGDAPERYQTGHELELAGCVRDATTCEPIPGARIIRWHADPLGRYIDYYRASMRCAEDGDYAFSTNVPGIYADLDRHIHFQVTAPGYRPLTTQIIWDNASLPPADNGFDFVLERP